MRGITIREWREQMEQVLQQMPDHSHGNLEIHRNEVGNLAILNSDGDYLGFIDVRQPDSSSIPVAAT